MKIPTDSRLRRLVQTKLAGRQIDVVGFVDELLEIVKEIGGIHCTLASEDRLRFELLDDQDVCEVELDAPRGKFRMLCARLAVLCSETANGKISPYGGDGSIKKNSLRPSYVNVDPVHEWNQWNVRFKNTSSEQGFSIDPV